MSIRRRSRFTAARRGVAGAEMAGTGVGGSGVAADEVGIPSERFLERGFEKT
jgi:hypothetical protein